MNALAHRVARRRTLHLPRALVLPRALRVLLLASSGTVAVITLAERVAGRIG